MGDFEWARYIEPSIILKPNKVYYIECGNDFDEVDIRNAFNKIFGVEMVNHSYEGRLGRYEGRLGRYINLFHNGYLNDSVGCGNRITFEIRYDDEFINTEWSSGGYFRDNYPDGEFISMDDFINCYSIYEDCGV